MDISQSAYWRRHFQTRWPMGLELPFSAPWPEAERALLAPSLRQFQLGEGSDGCRLLQFAHEFATRKGDLELPEAIAGLIAEEQRHSWWLGQILRGGEITPLKRHWIDDIFRRMRHQMGFGLEIAVLVCAEIVAVPYYTAVRRVTRWEPLVLVCDRILADEAFHLEFQAANLAKVLPPRPGLRRALHRALMGAIGAAVWVHFGRVLAAGGYSRSAFLAECRALLDGVHARSFAMLKDSYVYSVSS